MILTTIIITGLSLTAGAYLANQLGIKQREGKKWTIKQGKHYAEFSWFPLVLKKRMAGESVVVSFSIDPHTMLQDVPGTEDDWDMNKITGEDSLSMEALDYAWSHKDAPHHLNSWRIGWNYIPEEHKTQVALYYYKDMIRHIDVMAEIAWTDNGTELEDDAKDYYLTVNYKGQSTVFTLWDKTKMTATWTTTVEQAYTGLTYRLRPYFGGNNPAQKNCEVYYSFNR